MELLISSEDLPNNNGERMIEFCVEHLYEIENTLFKARHSPIYMGRNRTDLRLVKCGKNMKTKHLKESLSEAVCRRLSTMCMDSVALHL